VYKRQVSRRVPCFRAVGALPPVSIRRVPIDGICYTLAKPRAAQLLTTVYLFAAKGSRAEGPLPVGAFGLM